VNTFQTFGNLKRRCTDSILFISHK